MSENPHIILASKSAARKMMLENAGLRFEAIAADIDERGIEANFNHSPANLARELARQKALRLAESYPDALVIGSDSLVECEGEVLHKAENTDAALRKLMALSGKTHHLISAVSVAKGRMILWDHVQQASLTMRKFDENFTRHYLETIGKDAALNSVGSYQLEAQGAWLFEKIEGDYFTILGMPLIPLLAYLQDYHGVKL